MIKAWSFPINVLRVGDTQEYAECNVDPMPKNLLPIADGHHGKADEYKCDAHHQDQHQEDGVGIRRVKMNFLASAGLGVLCLVTRWGLICCRIQ